MDASLLEWLMLDIVDALWTLWLRPRERRFFARKLQFAAFFSLSDLSYTQVINTPSIGTSINHHYDLHVEQNFYTGAPAEIKS